MSDAPHSRLNCDVGSVVVGIAKTFASTRDGVDRSIKGVRSEVKDNNKVFNQCDIRYKGTEAKCSNEDGDTKSSHRRSDTKSHSWVEI